MEEKKLEVQVRYHRELCPELMDLEWRDNGDYVDLRAAENVTLKKGEYAMISLGVSMKLPKGYYGEMVPRSSMYKNFGIMQTNSPAIIDESYCGDNDVWKLSVVADRDTEIHVNDRLCQFTIKKKSIFTITEVEKLDGKDRGGLGSTGVK